MLAKILKPFPYAADGYTIEQLAAGQVRDIKDDLVEGLHKAGFIDEASDDEVEASQEGEVVVPPPVDVPAEWRALHWFKLKALAEKITCGPVANKVAATAIVEAYVAAQA